MTMQSKDIDVNSTYTGDTELWWDDNKQCYTTQPVSIPRTTTPNHDLVIIDLINYTTGNHLLAKAIDDRKKIGLAEYGTYLQAFNGRDCETDAIEEMADSICYLKQGIMEGKDYLEPIYHRAIALAVDTINLRYINSGGEIKGECRI